MAAPSDRDPDRMQGTEQPSRMGEGYFILGMAVQVGLVGLVGLALVGVEGMGFISLGTAIALAGLAIGILAIGSILTLASLRHTLNVMYDQGNQIDRVAERVGRLADELHGADEDVGWAGEEELDLTAEEQAEQARPSEDPHDRRPDPSPGSPPDPLEQEPVHPVVDVPGVDEDSAEILQEMGIEDTHQLRAQHPMYVAGRLETEPETIAHWQATADLMSLEGMDGESARMLAEAGLASVDELAHESPERVMDRVEGADLDAEAPPVGPQQADAWIQTAREHRAEVTEGRQEA